MLCKDQDTWLEKPLRVVDFPIHAALQKTKTAYIGIQGKQALLATGSGDLLVWVANALEAKLPIIMRLIRQSLRFASNPIYLTPSCSEFVDNTFFNIAP